MLLHAFTRDFILRDDYGGNFMAGTFTPCPVYLLSMRQCGRMSSRHKIFAKIRKQDKIPYISSQKNDQAKYTESGLEQVMSRPKFDHINSGPCRAELKMKMKSKVKMKMKRWKKKVKTKLKDESEKEKAKEKA